MSDPEFTSTPTTPIERGREQRYYTALGQAHDNLLRCKECRRLVLYAALKRNGGCPHCGNRKVIEVTSLSLLEWLRVRLGLLQFPHRHLFLKEFKAP